MFASFHNFLSDPFGANDDTPTSAWNLFLAIGLIIVLLAIWGMIFRAIAYAADTLGD